MRLPQVGLFNNNHAACRQGDYFFPLSIAFISTIIKEIRDKDSLNEDISKLRTSYVPIPTTSFL